MKHHEFYSKYKTSYPSFVNPLFSKRKWWIVALITVAALLIGPLIVYKHQRVIPFTLRYYLGLVGYFLFIVVPFIGFLVWTDWRESAKRRKGYAWIGKFEVTKKQSSFGFCYLVLAPGDSNRITVNRTLFEKIRVGDFIKVRRDALGCIEKIHKIKDFSSRLARARGSRHARQTET